MIPKQDLLCMIGACELFWLIHIFFCSVTCDLLYGKKTPRPRKHFKEALYSNASCYRAAACYRAADEKKT